MDMASCIGTWRQKGAPCQLKPSSCCTVTLTVSTSVVLDEAGCSLQRRRLEDSSSPSQIHHG
jgi:hypothetical protein